MSKRRLAARHLALDSCTAGPLGIGQGAVHPSRWTLTRCPLGNRQLRKGHDARLGMGMTW